MSEIRNICGEEQGLEISNKLINQYLAEELGESIQLSDSYRKNQSQFVFSSKHDTKDIVNILQSQDTIKDAAIKICQALLNMNFNLVDKFCD